MASNLLSERANTLLDTNVGDQLASFSLTLPFFALTIVSILLLVFLGCFALLARDASQPVVLNTLYTMLVYAINSIWTMIPQGGKMTETPGGGACLFQAANMVAGSPVLSVTIAVYTFFVWANSRSGKNRLGSWVQSRTGTVLLIALPWTVFLILFIASLGVGSYDFVTVQYRDLYCTIFNQGLNYARFWIPFVAMILSVLFDLAILLEIFLKYGTRSRRAHLLHSGAESTLVQDLLMGAEVWGFGLMLFTQALLIFTSPHEGSTVRPDMLCACSGLITLLLLGPQIGIFSSSTWRTTLARLSFAFESLWTFPPTRRDPRTKNEGWKRTVTKTSAERAVFYEVKVEERRDGEESGSGSVV